jgi:hypothetical protein
LIHLLAVEATFALGGPTGADDSYGTFSGFRPNDADEPTRQWAERNEAMLVTSVGVIDIVATRARPQENRFDVFEP